MRDAGKTEQARAAGAVVPHPGTGFPAARRFYDQEHRTPKTETQARRETEAGKGSIIARLIDVVALAADGTRRTVEGDEAAAAILREWDRAYEELTREEEADEAR